MKSIKYIFPFLIIFNSCIGWGDAFKYQKSIVGHYYISENEGGTSCSLYYNIGNGGIGRGPIDGELRSYAFTDTLLVIKVKPEKAGEYYYIINMEKDNAYADPKDYEVGRISADDYPNSWLAKLKLDFEEVEK